MRLWPLIISVALLLSCGSPHAKIRDAIDARDSSSVDALLAGGESPNAVVEYRYDELSLLALAARKGSAPIAKRLIEAGADVNLVFGEGKKTALLVACEHLELEVVRVLLAAGADVNYGLHDETCQTSFHGAFHHIERDVAQQRAFIELLTHTKSWKPTLPEYVISAVHQIEPDLLLLYLNAGLDLEGANWGETALVGALRRNEQDLARWLIGHGANLYPKVGAVDVLDAKAPLPPALVAGLRAARSATPEGRVAAFDAASGYKPPATRESERRRKEIDDAAAARERALQESMAAVERARRNEGAATSKQAPLEDLSAVAPMCEEPAIRACRATGKRCEDCIYDTFPKAQPGARCESGFVACGGVCCGYGYVCCINQKTEGETCRPASPGCSTGWDTERRKY